MKRINTKWELIRSLMTGSMWTGVLSNGEQIVFQTVCAVEVESGSMHSFNVTGYRLSGSKATVCIATED